MSVSIKQFYVCMSCTHAVIGEHCRRSDCDSVGGDSNG